MTWDINIAATTRPDTIEAVAWSPCDRFIAITCGVTTDILDSVTLQRLQTLEFQWVNYISTTLRALAFSPDSRILICFGQSQEDRELFVVSWDLQTGGAASIIRWQGLDEDITGISSITYSANRKMVGVYCWYDSGHAVFILDVASGVHVHSHSPTNAIKHRNGIWTHGESFRFTTIDTTTITIWEVGFTSDAIPTKVETLPAPEDAAPVDEDEPEEYVQFLPALCRLALVSGDKVMVWDAQNSKYLLYCTDTEFYPMMSFSPDGRFFTCSTTGPEIYLWKESPTGYMLHQILASGTIEAGLLLSQNGEWIAIPDYSTIRLLRVKGSTTPPSSVSTRTPQLDQRFTLDFSPDGMMAVAAELENSTVAVFNLESGALQLTIDTSMEVYGLRVIGNTITVIDNQKVVTWDLPSRDHVLDAEVTLEDSVRKIYFRGSPLSNVMSASISIDSRYIAFTTMPEDESEDGYFLHIYKLSIRKQVAQCPTPESTPWFAPGGRDLWLVDEDGEGRALRISSGKQVVQELGYGVDIEHPPEGYPWASSRGYRVTDDWWVLGPSGKRLLRLPPLWQSPDETLRVWRGRFLALVHDGLPQPVILELD